MIKGGYGTIAKERNGKRFLAHRVSWELHFGPIPDGMLVCHHCDNPPCVRPEHLFLGTVADNTMDAFRKGRLPQPAWGQNHCKAKLTDSDVIEIRRRKAAGERTRDLVKTFGITKGEINRIVARTMWKHIAEPTVST